MIRETMTAEQKQFAEDCHGLVYAFLNKKGLKVDDYYDVVIFSYLDSVVMYLSIPKTRKYSFSTIAWRNMERALGHHYEAQSRKKRNAFTVSFDGYGRERDGFAPADYLASTNYLMDELEMDLLMHEIASRVSKPQMDVIRMKADGYGVRDIARRQRMTMKGVADVLAGVRDIVLSVCNE